MCVFWGSCIVQGIESETLSPVKVYSCQYGPRTPEENWSREYKGMNGREDRKEANGNHNWWRGQKSFDMGKENIHGAVTLYQYASYIGQIYMSEFLRTITFFLHPQPNCHKRFITYLTKSIAVSLSLSLSLDLTYLYILSCEDGKIVFASGKRKILQNVHPTENKKRYQQQFFQSVCRQRPQNMYVVHWPYFSSVEVLNISREKTPKI